MIHELSHVLINEQSRRGTSLLGRKRKKKSPYDLLASNPYNSSPSAADDNTHNAAKNKRIKMSYIIMKMMIMMIKCLFFNNTYNTWINQ